MLLGNQRPNRKQEAPGERGLNISASFPELKAACQGLRAVLVLISPQPQIVVTPRTSWTLNPNFNLHLLEVEVGFLKGPCWSPCTCTHVHTHTHTYTHTHVHTHMYTHTYTHTHTHLQSHVLALVSDEAGSLPEMSAHTSRLPAAAAVACAGLLPLPIV